MRLGAQRRLPAGGGASGGACFRARHTTLLPRAGRRAEPFDPDAYEDEPLDDPDEYDDGFAEEQQAGAPWAAAAAGGDWLPFRAPAATAGAAAAAAASREGGNAGSSSGGEAAVQQGARPPRDRMSRTARLMLLLLGPALHRLATRLATAVLATARVTWQLGSEGVAALIASARGARQRAQQGFAASPAGERVRRWHQKLEAAQKELPEARGGLRALLRAHGARARLQRVHRLRAAPRTCA